MRKLLRPSKSNILARALLVLAAIAVALVAVASPANAIGNYNNSAIADKALSYVGQWGGNACNDAQKPGDSGGQCRAFVNCIVWMVSNHTQNLGGSDYYQPFLDAGGLRITDENQLVKGDIVQVGEGTHTFIIVSHVSGNTFNVVDSNHDPANHPEVVMNYNRTFTLDSTTRAYRMGSVSAGGGATNGHRSDVDKNGASDLVLTTNEPVGGSAAQVLLSTWQGFIAPQSWWHDTTVGWAGITPLVGDVNGDGRADYVFVANGGQSGVFIYVALSTGTSFGVPHLWWSGTQYNYADLKMAFGDVDGNGAEDVVFEARQPDGSFKIDVLLSTWQSFLAPQTWQTYPGWSWQYSKPLVGEVDVTIDPATHQPDHAADLVLLTNSASNHAQAWAGISSRASFVGPYLWWDGVGYGYSGIKPTLGDVDGNGAFDLVLTTNQPGGGTAAQVLFSTWQSFLAPQTWWYGSSTGWAGVTPMTADVTGDGKADYVFLANAGTGSPVYVAKAGSTSFGPALVWWNGAGYGYNGIKPYLQ